MFIVHVDEKEVCYFIFAIHVKFGLINFHIVEDQIYIRYVYIFNIIMDIGIINTYIYLKTFQTASKKSPEQNSI